jgi:uncharacterized protein (TIGR00255 family)
MNSMTGFGSASGEVAGRSLNVRVSSVNRKTLDIDCTLPREWAELEPDLVGLVRQSVQRGRVQVAIEFEKRARDADISFDEDAVSDVLARLGTFSRKRKLEFEPNAEVIWQIASSLRQAEGLPAPDKARPVLKRLLQSALRSFGAMRAKEGEALHVDFLSRAEALRSHVDAIASRAPKVAPAYRDALIKRLRDSGLELDPSDERVLREIALFADRCDVSEELTRLRSHLAQFGDLLKSEEPVGRRAEFLLQELFRESNTVGSKANDLEITRHVMEMKNLLEQVREQIANVE